MNYAFSFLKNKKVDDITKIIDEFFREELRKFIFPEIIDIINKHKRQSRNTIILSNAVDIIVSRVADYLGIKDYICTRPESVDGKFTGRIWGETVYGPNKVRFAKKFLEDYRFNFNNCYAYADYISDLDLLSVVKNSIVVDPDKILLREARKRGWPI